MWKSAPLCCLSRVGDAMGFVTFKVTYYLYLILNLQYTTTTTERAAEEKRLTDLGK